MENLEQTPETNFEYQTRQTLDLRKKAYACHLTGSDALLAEANRMKVMGEEGYKEKEQEAIARYEAIKAQYPWPKEQSE